MKNIRKTNRRRPEPLFDPDKAREKEGAQLTYHRDENSLSAFRKKAFYSLVLLIFFFSLIVARLWYLQIKNGTYYTELADSNRVRTLDIAAPRGNVYDRLGRELVTNRPSFNVTWLREKNQISDAWLKALSRVLQQEPVAILERIRKVPGPAHIPVRLAEDIDWDTVARIENNRMYLPEINIEVVPLRVYHHGNLAAHLIGYLGEVSKTELEKLNASTPGSYRGGDLVGKMGLEKLKEKDLRGEKGRSYMEVNALGFEQRHLKGEDPFPGNDMYLTLDLDLQKIAEEEMAAQNWAGAVVAMEVNTGRMLVLASAPTLHLEEFVGGISQKAWKTMLEDPLHPLVNKLVQGQYAPGSTYKPVTALAALAEGVITPETTFDCPGSLRFGNRVYRCWKHSGHGSVNLKRALAESCDVYFYQVGLKLGVDRLAKYANMLGLGRPTGIEMEHERPGLIPTAAWKKKEKKQPWMEGETLSIAIGQGYDLVTPVQLALMTSVIANGGTLYKPTVIEEIRSPDGTVVSSFKPEVLSRITGQAKNLRLVREGMIEAVNGLRGTGRQARVTSVPGITVGGKTGTAQVVRLKQYQHLREEDIPYQYRDNAWFTCFAPGTNPEIAVVVLVEHGLHGGSAAAPIAGKILNQYFAQKRKEMEDKGPSETMLLSDSQGGKGPAYGMGIAASLFSVQ